jgi:hypothetical protein
MAEEVRFFLRTAVYSGVIALIYWFASYEPDGVPYSYDWAGTGLLAFTVLGAGVVVGGMMLTARSSWHRRLVPREASVPRRVGETLNRVIGLEHGSAEQVEQPFAGGPEIVSAGSPWPVAAAVAVSMVLLGLVYGAWLIAPGVVLLVVAVGGWVSGP